MAEDTKKPADEWLDRARSAFESSTSYIDTNYRGKWEDAIKLFQNKHPKGSKYNSDAYKYRSKIFRPKTRSAVRKMEAAAAAAFFSTQDSVFIDPMDDTKPEQRASAAVMKELLDYRLQKTIPWFLTVIGGIQDAQTVGVVCSYQYWKYQERKKKVKVQLVDELGNVLDEQEREDIEVIKDEPCVELLPVENYRFHPSANWMNPVQTSPYFIRLVPMYVYQLKAKMREEDPKTGQPKWKKLTDQEISSTLTRKYDSTRLTREGQREDPAEVTTGAINDYDLVWAHENFIKDENDEDQVYWTLGTEYRLTDPKPLKEVYFHNERPITLGYIVLETHKNMPDGPVMLGEGVQKEINEIANSRLDNVKLVLNKRWLVKRGSQADLKSLVRNAAGSVTLVTDPKDVLPIEFDDITSSAYAEQDRLNVDYDELIGNFSQGSVQTNRKLNETVGGMSMIQSSAGQMTEYGLRVFVETWMEPTLRQLVKLEQAYETDTVLMALAAEKAEINQKYGINEVTDTLLNQELSLRVNVGLGATNPMFRLERFLLATGKFSEIAAAGAPGLNLEQVGQEIFGLAGYREGKRFFTNENPEVAKLTQQVQALEQELNDRNAEIEAKLAAVDAQNDAKLRAVDMQNQGKIAVEALKQDREDARHEDQITADLIKHDSSNEIALQAQ